MDCPGDKEKVSVSYRSLGSEEAKRRLARLTPFDVVLVDARYLVFGRLQNNNNMHI